MNQQFSSDSLASLTKPVVASLRRLVITFAALLFASGCADVEYSSKLATLRTNCKGTEIVGVWVSKLKNGPYGMQTKFAMLVRPNGTGIMRYAGMESTMEWNYVGSGTWRGSCSWGGWEQREMTIHFDGQELLLAAQGMRLVFVRADDQAAVEDHLMRRR
ncbi:MAG: hypothetical protein K8R87_01415 [Verrucomicrobia bacterium]|nr:hypothetical protein [Verrucomicrobiota bacterium]